MKLHHYDPAANATPEERAYALRVGAAVLRANWPELSARCSIFIGARRLRARVAMEPGGVVRVTLPHTGALVAQSLPAPMDTLDVAASGCPDHE